MQTASAVYTGPMLHRKQTNSGGILKASMSNGISAFPLENPLYTLQDPCSAGKTCHIDSEEMEDSCGVYSS